MPKENLSVYVATHISPADDEKLTETAERLDRSKSWVIREALRAYLTGHGPKS